MEEPIVFQEKRNVGEIIIDSFRFIGSEKGPLFKFTVLYALPFIIILSALQLVITSKLSASLQSLREMQPEMMLQELGGVYKDYFLILIFSVFVQSLFMAVVYSYIHAYLDRGKGNFSNSEITTAFFSNAYIILGTALLVTLISLIGVIFCILPGILLANSLSLSVFIAIYERKGIGYSISRSWKLVNLQWWGTFALNLIGILTMKGVEMVISIPATMGIESNTIINPGESFTQMASNWRVWVMIISSVISSLLGIIVFVFQVFQYFNLKELEKEFPGIK
jgi:hypothetical protein